MIDSQLQAQVDSAWEARDEITPGTTGEIKEAVEAALGMLDSGQARVAEKSGDGSGEWHVNQWLKKAVLLSFRLNDMEAVNNSPGDGNWWDKCHPNFLAGRKRNSPQPASGPSPTASSAVRPILHQASC